MKKTLLLIVCALAGAWTLGAQTSSEILNRVDATLAKTTTVSGRFHEVRTPAVKEQKPVELTGKIVFKPDTFLSMLYDNGDQFTIDGDKMVVQHDGNPIIYNLTKNLMMRGLSHTLLYSFKGDLPLLAEEQDAEIQAVKEKGRYVVTLTPRKKTARGISRLVVSYDAATCAIREMILDEPTGASTRYSMD